MKRCEGKVALVTGGVSGIGAACTELLAQEGATVLATDVRRGRGAAFAAACRGRVEFMAHDVTRESAWEAAVNRCLAAWGRLDVLVNNAGITHIERGQTPETITLEEWRGVNAVNTEGVVMGCKHGIRGMRESGGGSIVNISSVGGTMESPLAYPYGASKAAVLQITKTVAVHCARNGYGIRCNAVLPGTIATDMFLSMPEDTRRQSMLGVPLGYAARPLEIARAVMYLASDESAYVTGAHLAVDGGITAANPMRTPTE